MMTFRRIFLVAICLLLAVFFVACSGPNTNGQNTGYTNGQTQTKDNNMKTQPNMNGQNMDNNMKDQNGQNMDNNMNDQNGQNMGNNMNDQNMGNKQNDQNMGNNMNGQGGNGKVALKTMQVMLNGKPVTVLATDKGFLLYYRNNDPAPDSGCTGECAKEWPPVLAQDAMSISVAVTLPKKLTVHKTANGNQVLYDGHPLYTYTGDMNPGQFNGRAMDNVWYLVGVQL